MTRHKMHCPQKYATVFSFFPIRRTHIRRVRRVLSVPIVITPAAQLETTAAHSVKRSKQFSSIILISTRLDFYLYFPIRFDFDFKFDFCFFFLFHFFSICWQVMLGLVPFLSPFLRIILINYIAFYHCEQLSYR